MKNNFISEQGIREQQNIELYYKIKIISSSSLELKDTVVQPIEQIQVVISSSSLTGSS